MFFNTLPAQHYWLWRLEEKHVFQHLGLSLTNTFEWGQSIPTSRSLVTATGMNSVTDAGRSSAIILTSVTWTRDKSIVRIKGSLSGNETGLLGETHRNRMLTVQVTRAKRAKRGSKQTSHDCDRFPHTFQTPYQQLETAPFRLCGRATKFATSNRAT